MVLGDYVGGELEVRGCMPTPLNNEATMIDGNKWHRTLPIWEGDRVSFVAFIHEAISEIGKDEKLKLTKLGFRLPSPLLLEKLVREKKARDADKEPGGKKAEKVRKGAAQSYKNVGRKEKQMEQFPKLMEEIKKIEIHVTCPVY